MANLDTVLTKAYEQLNRDRGCSTEDITCDPTNRESFLNLVWMTLPEVSEADALRRLSYLRKRARLPRGRRDQQTDAGHDPQPNSFYR